jgi:hypothetical protein
MVDFDVGAVFCCSAVCMAIVDLRTVFFCSALCTAIVEV